MRAPLTVGSVVRSMAGRDQDRWFVVTQELDDSYVMIVDGALRGLNRPKKKKRKHLRAVGKTIALPLQDHEIRKQIKALRDGEEE